MEPIIGREKEIAELQEYYDSKRPEFIAVYGRRRVGKTVLIRHFLNDKYDFFATGIIDGTRQEEMESFYSSLKQYGYNGLMPKSWIQAFDILAEMLERKSKARKRINVFIDELPCFDTQHSGFIHALDKFWNGRASKLDNIFLVICGSATSWMIKNVLNNKGGLHGRITHDMHIYPFNLLQTEKYFASKSSKMDRLSLLQLYMALGGVPYYLNMVKPKDSVADNIDRLFFSKDAPLRREYSSLYRSLYKNPERYMELVKLLADNKKGLTRSEIAKKMNIKSGGTISVLLEDLVNCDFVLKSRNGGKSNDSIYQLIDFYTLFYHQFVAKGSSDSHYWRNILGTPKQNTWYGLAYERICKYHIEEILEALHLDSIHTECYAWRSKESDPGAQIDMIIDRSDGIVNICEVKYSKGEYSLQKDEYQKILNRMEAFASETKTKKGLRISLITTFGAKVNQYSEISDRIVCLDDLFR